MCTLILLTGALGQESVAPYEIAAMHAYLFYNYSGDFSDNVIDNEEFILWNTIIGEGSAFEPSDATLVIVYLGGEAGAYEPARQIELTAMEEGKVALKQTADLGVFSEEGRYAVAFWLYNTGCVPVELSVRITGQSKESKKTARINFACGE